MIHGDTSSTCFGSVNNLLVEKERRGGGNTTQFISFFQYVLGIYDRFQPSVDMWIKRVKDQLKQILCIVLILIKCMHTHFVHLYTKQKGKSLKVFVPLQYFHSISQQIRPSRLLCLKIMSPYGLKWTKAHSSEAEKRGGTLNFNASNCDDLKGVKLHNATCFKRTITPDHLLAHAKCLRTCATDSWLQWCHFFRQQTQRPDLKLHLHPF